jgi:allophanate hydrolase
MKDVPMADALLRVVQAGPHVTIQDGGRRGMMRYGVPASGPMDRKALVIANTALGNAPGAAGIEVSPGGLVLDCVSGAVTLAAAGGGFILDVDGTRRGSWCVFGLRAGQRLVLRPGQWGCWMMLAVAGQIDRPDWLGSLATHGASGLGGGKLAAGDELRVTATRAVAARALPCPVSARPRPLLHAVAGPQDRFFGPDAMSALQHGGFRLTSAYDRMGVRLAGPELRPQDALSIPSEPILRGSVQVSGDGVATVLLADHQTTGGYPKIATVIDDDLDGFVQCRPGQEIRFRLIPPETAVSIARQRAASFARYLGQLAPAG